MTGAEAIIKTSIESGINVCFTNFGTTELHLIAALDSVPGIRPVLCLFEGVCSGASDGYARMLDKPAMTLLHLGPGLSNAMANLHNAKRAHSQMFNVIGEHALWHRDSDAPEVMDLETLAKPVSDLVHLATSPETVSQDTSNAISCAMRGNVATLIVPQDVQWNECHNPEIESGKIEPELVEPQNIDKIVRLLKSGRRTTMIIGSRGLRTRGLRASARIHSATGCALVAETLPGRMERGLGVPFIGRIPYSPELAFQYFSQYESIILAGVEAPVAFFAYQNGRSKLLTGNQQTYLLGTRHQDLEEALEQLADTVDSTKQAVSLTSESHHMRGNILPKGSLTTEKACMVLAVLQPEGSIVVDESVTSGFSYYELATSAPSHDWLSITGGAIGQGIPCSIGAAIACPHRPVINLQADGSAMYTVQALWTQAREGLNITTLICSNRTYNILRIEMAHAGLTPPGKVGLDLTDLTRPPINWVQISKGMGVPAVSVTTAEQLAIELSRALSESGPHLIDMIFSG
ncbi:MAG: acetolactate synthase large subunit [Desulfomonilaceae bacterium]